MQAWNTVHIHTKHKWSDIHRCIHIYAYMRAWQTVQGHSLTPACIQAWVHAHIIHHMHAQSHSVERSNQVQHSGHLKSCCSSAVSYRRGRVRLLFHRRLRHQIIFWASSEDSIASWDKRNVLARCLSCMYSICLRENSCCWTDLKV